MFKNIIAPVQAWLLSQGRCVGCGMPLKKSPPRAGPPRAEKLEELVTCKCGRVFVYDGKTGKYRRALLSEV
ncbi:hypothetical protein HY946_00920 [Candidatus Gottesmanbacteria bacterium]|nr:hypothetical protein [Candidatus Gottesmanbacteria bacterium]